MNTYKIVLQPYGTRFLIAKVRQDLYQWLQKNNVDVETYMESYKELNIPTHMKPDFEEEDEDSSWLEDFGCNEYSGICLSNSCFIEVYDDNDIVWSSSLDLKSLKKYGVQVQEPENLLNSSVKGTIFFVGEYNSKDNSEYELKTMDTFNPKLLELTTENINDVVFIRNVRYGEDDIDWIDGGGEDKGWSFFFHVSKGQKPKSPHIYPNIQCTNWFDTKIKPTRNGFYEVKKCDEKIETELMKWNGKKFLKQIEDHEYDKNWNIQSTKIIDVEVPFTDISCWRGLNKQT